MSSVQRFRTAARAAAFGLTVMGSTMAGATVAEAQAHEQGQEQAATLADLGLMSNTSLPKPRISGQPPVMLMVNVTENTAVWIDAKGATTYAPDALAEATSRATIKVIGSSEARFGSTTGARRAALEAEPLLFHGADHDAAQIEQARQIVDHRLGNRYKFTGTQVVMIQGDGQVPAAGGERGRAGRVADAASDMPGRVVENAANDAIYSAEWGLRAKIGQAAGRAVERILKP